MDWDHWYQQYDQSPSLQARLGIVREQIAATLDQCAAGPINILSICAGDGRDVVGALAGHARRADVAAWLLDTHAESIARGQAAAAAAALEGPLHVRQCDAGRAQSYGDLERADLVMLSGFLGHLRHDEAAGLIASLPMLIKPGGAVLWNRHLVMNDGRTQVPAIRALLQQASFEETYFQTTAEDGFAVGRARFKGNVAILDPEKIFFEFGGRHEPEEKEETKVVGESIDAEQSLAACFERLAVEHPRHVAVGSGDWQSTYEELNAAANRIAHGLIARGGTLQDRVALLLPHDTPLIAAILAVLKAGRTVVVLNPGDPPGRLEQLLAHADPAVILTDHAQRALAEDIAREKFGVACIEEYAGGSTDNPVIPIDPDNLAWLIYTSGSTGAAKAVMQTHRNILHNAMRNAQGLEMVPEDRVLLLASPSGGQGVGTIWCTLLQGATLCLFPAAQKGVSGLADWMVTHRISVYVSSASIFRNFVKGLDSAVRFAGVRIVRLASEPATYEDLAAYKRHFSDTCILLQTLSSSETGNLTQCRMRHDEPPGVGRLPVGTPAAGIEIRLLDGDGRETPAGTVGEVVVRSRYLSPGYWRNEKLTAERFSGGPSPTGLRQYHTGDQARRLPDGRLLFMGRKDSQVKIHGFKVELSEVEAALERQPEIQRAAVCARALQGDEVQLVAYMVLRDGQTTTADALRTALGATLPGHMVPGAFVFLESFPLTAHGKIDRVRLPAPPTVAALRGKAAQPPRDKVEKVLTDIWEVVLNIGGISRNENFFDLGGTSLQALAIVARIEDEFGKLPPLSLFLDAGTIEQQAATLCQPWAALHSTVLPLRQEGDRPPLYCVHGAGVEVFAFNALTRHLDPRQPVFGLLSPGLLGEWPPATFEEFAQRQVTEILQHQPAGPCSLVGHCGGGLLALEIAHQLNAAGKSVQLVALIDSMVPGKSAESRSSSPRQRMTDWVAHRFRKLRWFALLAAEFLAHRPSQRFGAPYRSFADYAFKDALRRYHVKTYAGPVVAFLAEQPQPWRGLDARELLIRDYLPQAQVFRVPGSHEGYTALRAARGDTGYGVARDSCGAEWGGLYQPCEICTTNRYHQINSRLSPGLPPRSYYCSYVP